MYQNTFLKFNIYITILLLSFLVTNQIYGQSINNITNDTSLQQATESAGISLDYLAQSDSLSRYDLTRLLNAVECKDCINPSPTMSDTYDNDFRSAFITIPGEDFRDILYKQGIYQSKSYYYCVASVADRNYMNGFPILTSPTCPGDFCGSRSVTKGEFFQTVINILKKYIYKNYTINRSQVSDRYTGLAIGEYAKLMFTSKDRETLSGALTLCPQGDCSLSSTEQFDIYMKYCMFNLSSCDMKDFGILKAGYRPIAEMNIALHEGLIADTNISTSIHQSINPGYAIQVLGKLFPRIACEFNLDYDCDGITNKRDNCPTTYNPDQANTDRDSLGNVCDDDIDGDGVMNPIGIVDARGNINSVLWQSTTDNCLFVANKDQKDNDKDRQGDSCDMSSLSSLFIQSRIGGTGSNRQLIAESIYEGDKKDLQRSIEGDGKTIYAHGPFIRQNVGSGGTYTINVFASQDKRIYASATVIVPEYHPRASALIQTTIAKSYLPSIIQSNIIISGPGSYTLRTLKGTTAQDQSKRSDISEKVNFLIRIPGTYTLTAIVKEGNITTAVAEQQIIVVSDTMILGGQTTAYRNTIQKDISFPFRITVITGRVNDINIDWGDGSKQTSRSLTNSHSYGKSGSYVVRNIINFIDGESLRESYTILVSDGINTNDTINSKYLGISVNPFRGVNYIPITWSGEKIGYTDQEVIHNFFFDGEKVMTELQDTLYHDYGIMYPSFVQTLGQCQTTANQGTFIVEDIRNLSCLEKNRRGLKPVCDMDRDGIDDTCDDDIDGDGVKNAIGVVTHNLGGCTITTANVDQTRYLDHFRGSCQLDNCPFTINADQKDTNKDFIGDVCTNKLSGAQWLDNKKETSDQDGDQVPDDRDQCIDIAETYNGYKDDDGCPELGSDNICNQNTPINNIINIGECLQCPCQYAAIPADLDAGNHIRASIRNKSGSIAQGVSDEHTVP